MLQHCHRNHFLHDLISRVFLRSLQYGIVVMGFLDAFVRPDVRTFPMIVPQHVQEELTSEDGLLIQTEVLASLMVKLWLDGV